MYLDLDLGGSMGHLYMYMYLYVYCILYCCTVVLYYYCNYCKNDFTALIDSLLLLLLSSLLILLSSPSSSLQRSQRSDSTPPKKNYQRSEVRISFLLSIYISPRPFIKKKKISTLQYLLLGFFLLLRPFSFFLSCFLAFCLEEIDGWNFFFLFCFRFVFIMLW